MSDALIRSALEARLVTAAGFPDANHRALENATYEPQLGETWARITHRWGNEVIETFPRSGGRVFRFGIMQVDLFVDVASAERLDTLCEAVKAVLPPGLSLSPGAGITDFYIRESRRWGGQRERSWWWDHVDVRWDCRARNQTF